MWISREGRAIISARIVRSTLRVSNTRAVHLHNEFILGIMHNAQSYVPIPSGTPSKGFAPLKNPGDYDLDVVLKRTANDSSISDARRIKRRRDILSLSREDRERLETLSKGDVSFALLIS
jgi:hypothetical protein